MGSAPVGYSGKPPCLPVRKGERAFPRADGPFFVASHAASACCGTAGARSASFCPRARRLADPPSELREMEPAPAPDVPIGGLHDVSSTRPWFGLSAQPRPVSYTHLTLPTKRIV